MTTLFGERQPLIVNENSQVEMTTGGIQDVLFVVREIALEYPQFEQLEEQKQLQLLQDADAHLRNARESFNPRNSPQGIRNYNKHASRADLAASITSAAIGISITAILATQAENMSGVDLAILVAITVLAFCSAIFYGALASTNNALIERRGYAALPLVESYAEKRTQSDFDKETLRSFFTNALPHREAEPLSL